MAKSSNIVIMFSIAFMFLLLAENHATDTSEAPTPSQQPNTRDPKFPTHGITQGSLAPQDCSPRCATRCSNTQYKKPCLFFCNKCCATCLCVPPGFYGHKEVCPCYNNWKTKRGGSKCP